MMDGVVDGEGDVTCQSCPHLQDVRWKGPTYGVPSGALTPARLSEPSLELVSRSTFTQLPAQKLCPPSRKFLSLLRAYRTGARAFNYSIRASMKDRFEILA